MVSFRILGLSWEWAYGIAGSILGMGSIMMILVRMSIKLEYRLQEDTRLHVPQPHYSATTRWLAKYKKVRGSKGIRQHKEFTNRQESSGP